MPSEDRQITLMESLVSAPPVLLVSANGQTFECDAVILATMLIMGRVAGWRGGSSFFHEGDGISYLLEFREGNFLLQADAFDLAQKLRHSVETVDSEGADMEDAFIEFFAQGGCIVRTKRQR